MCGDFSEFVLVVFDFKYMLVWFELELFIDVLVFVILCLLQVFIEFFKQGRGIGYVWVQLFIVEGIVEIVVEGNIVMIVVLGIGVVKVMKVCEQVVWFCFGLGQVGLVQCVGQFGYQG